MRILVALALGLAVGFALALIAARAMSVAGAHPRATMVVMARHMDALRAANGAATCDDREVAARLGQVRAMAREIDFAFAESLDDSAFARRSGHFAAAADAATAAASGCEGLPDTLASLGQACQDCHRDFR